VTSHGALGDFGHVGAPSKVGGVGTRASRGSGSRLSTIPSGSIVFTGTGFDRTVDRTPAYGTNPSLISPSPVLADRQEAVEHLQLKIKRSVGISNPAVGSL